jgi:hypothetical protein
MAVVNTGIVLRTITGVNESDLFLDSESTSVATNTGIVERSIVDSHDANFVHPIGDEEITNGGFDTDSNWNKNSNWSISGGVAIADGSSDGDINQGLTLATIGKSYKISYEVVSISQGGFFFKFGGVNSVPKYSVGVYTETIQAINTNRIALDSENNAIGSIDNISVKEVLVNRESTATNTGIVERPITGVNESDPMFPDNTISNIVNIAGLISSLIADLKARATTFENEDATRNILINLQNC